MILPNIKILGIVVATILLFGCQAQRIHAELDSGPAAAQLEELNAPGTAGGGDLPPVEELKPLSPEVQGVIDLVFGGVSDEIIFNYIRNAGEPFGGDHQRDD
jgi:hypothetical protein